MFFTITKVVGNWLLSLLTPVVEISQLTISFVWIFFLHSQTLWERLKKSLCDQIMQEWRILQRSMFWTTDRRIEKPLMIPIPFCDQHGFRKIDHSLQR